MNTGPPAKVTGISPNEGVPGTKLTLRGEYFGKSALDLTHVFVGGIDVSPSARWFSTKKLSVITPLGTGELEIVIVTKSGGIGTSDLTYNQNVAQKIGAQEQVSYWPEDERRRCPAIIERGSGGSRPEGGGADVADASILCSATGIPVAELSRFGIPLSDSALAKLYPSTGSVQLSEPDFDPLLFLLKFYKNASFEDLVMARNNFSQSITASGSHESSSVIKNNLYLIFRCLEGMEDLKEQMDLTNQGGEAKRTDNQSFPPRPPRRSKIQEGTIEMRLERKLTEALHQGNVLFADVLRCREKADSTRNVLNIMQRFHFLFHLPETIRTNIKQGEYNLAINDYKRAKSLFCGSDVEAFQRVYSEVESVVARFRDSLKTELVDVPIEVDEAMKRIKCLYQLELDYDPCFLCLKAFKAWLVDQLRTYQSNYQQHLTLPSGDETRPIIISPQSKKALIIQLVQKVCSLLSTHFVQFWRLQSVCLIVSKENLSNFQNGQQTSENRYQALNVELIHFLASCVREVVLEPGAVGTTEAISSGWATTCIQEFRNCCLSLPLDIVPKDAQVVLRRLSYDLRRHAIRDVLRSSQTAIESLHFKENWEVEVNDEGGSITQLPLAYESLVLESLSRCRTLMSPRTSLEDSLFDSAEYQERFLQMFAETMLGFLTTLQRLADQIEASLPTPEKTSQHATCLGAVVAQARGLLLLVSNADWAARRVNTRVFNSYSTAGYSNVVALQETVMAAWKSATDALVERYIRIRVWCLCCPLDPQQNTDSNVSWSVIMSAVCNLSHIHAELVLLLGMPPDDASKRLFPQSSAVNGDSTINIASPDSITADEVTLPSYYRMTPIIKTIAIKLSDIIQRGTGEKSTTSKSESRIQFILELLQSLISGNSLRTMIENTSDERNSSSTLEGMKRSLSLVASALDSRIPLSPPLDLPRQALPSSRRVIHRPHLRPRPPESLSRVFDASHLNWNKFYHF